MMPVDVPEEEWDNLQIVFATSEGDVRRNRLSDFTNVMPQRQDRDEVRGRLGRQRLIGARICDENDDFMLVTATGKAIRFRSQPMFASSMRGAGRLASVGSSWPASDERRLDVRHPPLQAHARGTCRLPEDAPCRGRG